MVGGSPLHPYFTEETPALGLGEISHGERLSLCRYQARGLSLLQRFLKWVLLRLFHLHLCPRISARIVSRVPYTSNADALDVWWTLTAPLLESDRKTARSIFFSKVASFVGYYYCSRTDILMPCEAISVRLHWALR